MRSVVITGSSTGIGRACALALDRSGFQVFAGVRREGDGDSLRDANSEYSDRPFAEKRDMQGGFRESPLRLNAGLGRLDKWDEAAIDARASRLAEMASRIWRAPQLPADVLDKYRPSSKPSVPTVYTIDDHHHLAAGTLARDLFELFRKEVMALDPCGHRGISEAVRGLQGGDQLR